MSMLLQKQVSCGNNSIHRETVCTEQHLLSRYSSDIYRTWCKMCEMCICSPFSGHSFHVLSGKCPEALRSTHLKRQNCANWKNINKMWSKLNQFWRWSIYISIPHFMPCVPCNLREMPRKVLGWTDGRTDADQCYVAIQLWGRRIYTIHFQMSWLQFCRIYNICADTLQPLIHINYMWKYRLKLKEGVSHLRCLQHRNRKKDGEKTKEALKQERLHIRSEKETSGQKAGRVWIEKDGDATEVTE